MINQINRKMSDSESHEVNIMSDSEAQDGNAHSDIEAQDGNAHSDIEAQDGNAHSDSEAGSTNRRREAQDHSDSEYVSLEDFNNFKKKMDIEMASLRKMVQEFNKTAPSSPAPTIDSDPIGIEHVRNKILLSGNTEKYKDVIIGLGYLWNADFESYIITTTDSVNTIASVKDALGGLVKIDDKTKGKSLVLTGVSTFGGVKGGKITIEFYKNALAVKGDTRDVKDILKDKGGKWNASLKCWVFSKKDREFIDELINMLSEFNVDDRTKTCDE